MPAWETRAVWGCTGEQGKRKAGQALGWPQSSSAERASCGGDVMAEECVGTEWGLGRHGVGGGRVCVCREQESLLARS